MPGPPLPRGMNTRERFGFSAMDSIIRSESGPPYPITLFLTKIVGKDHGPFFVGETKVEQFCVGDVLVRTQNSITTG